MKAMVMDKITDIKNCPTPLELKEIPIPDPGKGEVLIKVSTCGVCHTELDEIEGRTAPPSLPIILGHQAVGKIVKKGENANRFSIGERVGVGWIYSACRSCDYCASDRENLCNEFKATGRDADGGYAEYMVAPEDYAYRIPDTFSDNEAAPLLCAGSIGYRALKLTGIENGNNLGLTGFGASGHLVLKMAKHIFPNTDIYVFARKERERNFALDLGAVWAGDINRESPEKLDAIIDTTPAWKPVVESLKNLKPGGRLVINAIRKEELDKNHLLNIIYEDHIWLEKEIKSVANITRRDISEFLDLAADIPLKPETEEYGLEEANQALHELKEGNIRGSKVLVMD